MTFLHSLLSIMCRRSFIFLIFFCVPFFAFSQTPIYSINSGTWTTTGNWSLTGHSGASCSCVPGSSNDVKIGNGHSMTISSGSSTITVNSITVADVGTGTLTFGNTTNTSTTLNVGDIIVNSSTGTFKVGGDGGATHVLNVTGGITNNGSFSLVGASGDVVNMTYNASAVKNFDGTGTAIALNNLTMASGTSNVNINIDVTIAGTLNWAGNALLIVNSTSNITLGKTATMTNFNSSRYIQLDGSVSSGSQLIKTNNNSTASWAIVFPVGTSTGGYTPLDLTTANGATITTAPTNNSTLAVKPIYGPSIQGQMRRQFRLFVTANTAATTFTSGDFYYNSATDISTGDVQANYNTLWYLSAASGTWVNVTGTAPGTTFFSAPGTAQTLASGTYYYAIGNSTGFTNTWYSYQTGNWNDPDVWTLDPSGTTLVNPLTQTPLNGDAVVILNGFTVTSNVSSLVLSTTTIQGGAVLDLSTTTGHNLGTVSGTGLLRVKGSSLPTGTYTSFVASTGGTVEYYDVGGTLTTQGTYNKLIFSNTTSSNITFISVSNLTINGTLDITQTSGTGTVTWQINDNSPANRTIVITGDVTVGTGGKITVGTGNSTSTTQHAVTLSGNLTNNGSIQFYDPTDATYSTANYTSGAIYTQSLRGNAANVTFSGVTDKIVTCNGVTDFYRLIVNKGTGQQAMLTINSSSAANFRLFAPDNQDLSGTAPNLTSDNALSLVNGTLQLTGTITIPTLVVNGGGGIGGGWPIPQNAALWINSANVNITVTNSTDTGDNGRQMYVFGKLQLSNGTVSMGYSRGLLGGGSGVFVIDGGTLNTRQLRTTYLGSNNRFAYTQTGGTVNVATTGITGVDINTYPRFALPYPECSFTMSGGVLNVAEPTTSGTSVNGGILIFAATSNIQVSGGTVNAICPATAVNFTITSTAPFFDLNISKAGAAGASVATLAGMSFNDGTTFARAAQPLVVMNSLTLVAGNSPGLTCNANNVTIGKNFDIQTGSTFTPGANTLTFNGATDQNWINNGTISSLNNVVMSKTGTLFCSGSTLPNIVGLTLTTGTINDGGKVITVTSTLSNSATHTGTGAITCNGPTTIGGAGGTFANLNITTNGTVTTSGSQAVTGDLHLVNANSTLSILSYNLNVTGGIYSDASTGTGGFSATKRILTNGLRNDGGLTRKPALGVDLLFPVGTTTLYTPNTINITTASAIGTITVCPVKSAHPNVTTTSQSLQYFWRVTSTGFTGVSGVTHKTYTFSTATKDPPLTAYTPARWDPSSMTWAYRTATYDATGTTVIPNFNTGSGWTGLSTSQLDGEYTAGNSGCFGAVTIYYSRVSSGSWGTASSWSTTAINGPAAGSTPCSTCPVIIGDASNNHTINISANSQSCGSLTIAGGSVLDCGAFTSLNFGVNTSGTGKIRIGSANFPAGDFVNFLGSSAGGIVEWYGPAYTIPSTGPAPQTISLATYYSLIVNPDAGVTITMPARDLTIYSDFTVTGGSSASQVNTDVGAARTITGNNLNVTAGTFSIRNGNITNFVLTGNTTVSTGATFSVQNSGGTRTHTFTTSGNFTNNGTTRFRSGTGAEYVNLTFTGTANTSLTGTNSATGTTVLAGLTVNKGTSQVPTLTVDVQGSVSTLNNAWLTLTNGTANFNNSASYTVTNASATTFSIPSTAALQLSNGTMTISSISADNSDVLLSGALTVSGGAMSVGVSTNNTNNDIEYSSAGSPTINVSGGTLYVNGAIRRATTTLDGDLTYNQTGGAVTIGGRNTTSNNTRAVLEVVNDGRFVLANSSTLTIARPSGGTLFADVYLDPASSLVSAASTITLGITATTQTMTIDITPSIGSLLINDNTTVSMQSSTLTTTGSLTLNTPLATLTTNSLDVTIGGDLTINGTAVYNGTVGSGNTTIFNGTGTQTGTLSSGSTFLNMTVNKPSGTVSLSAPVSPTVTNLNILSGILDVNSLNLSVIGDVVNNSTQINTGGAGSISLAGGTTVTLQNITSSGGSFSNLTLTGTASSKVIYVTGNMIINGKLSFATTNRYLYIGSSLLTFGSGSSVTGAGNTAFVRTNGVSSDLGVTKTWATGAGSFTYPIGTRTNYTPLTVTLNVSAAGDLSVVPVDDRHPTANSGSSEQILNYYWIVTHGSGLAYSTTGSHVYGYPASLMGGTGGTLTAGYLDIAAATPGWVTSGHGGTATTTTMTFTNLLDTNLPTSGNTFHYSVGTVNTLPNPITPIYSRLADPSVANVNVGGDWNNTNSWTLSSDGMGAAWGSIPYGNSVVILANSRINISATGRSAFITQVDGLIVLPSNKVGHNFGIVKGTGTIQTNTSTLPAGNYTSFVSSSGGTIEYVGPLTMNNRTTYNNLKVSGSGNVTMTNTDIVLNGNMIISAGGTLNNSTNNRNISVAKDWTNNGTFTTGTGTVTFTGSSASAINGATSFYNLAINKSSANVTLSTGTTTTVTNNLTLTSGNIVASSTHVLALGSSTITGGSASSFIGGPVTKLIAAGGSFAMPLGSIVNGLYRPATIANTSASDTWRYEYVGNNPAMQGYSYKDFNTSTLGKVSMYEYWNISRTGATVADLSLTYGVGSYDPPNVGTVSSLRVVKWNTGTGQWELATGATSFTQSGTNISGTNTATGITSFSPHTHGSTDPNSTLPISLLYFRATLDNDHVNLTWKTASEKDNDYFTVERAINPETFIEIGRVQGHGTTAESHSYSTIDTHPAIGTSYYRLKQTDFNGDVTYSSVQVVHYDGPAFATLNVYPNPSKGKSFNVEIVGLKDVQDVPVQIMNAQGQIVYGRTFTVAEDGAIREEIAFKGGIPSGVYIVKAGRTMQLIRKIVVE